MGPFIPHSIVALACSMQGEATALIHSHGGNPNDTSLLLHCGLNCVYAPYLLKGNKRLEQLGLPEQQQQHSGVPANWSAPVVCLPFCSSPLGLAGPSTWSRSREHNERHQHSHFALIYFALLCFTLLHFALLPVTKIICPQMQHRQAAERAALTRNHGGNSPLAAYRYQLSMIRRTLPDDAGNIKLTVAVLTVPSGSG